MVVILVREEDAYAVVVHGTRIVVVSPDKAEEERPSRSHDGNIRQGPPAVVVG